MRRNQFISGKRKDPHIIDPTIKSGQMWDSIHIFDFGTGAGVRFTILARFKHPLTGKWMCQVNNYQEDTSMLLVGVDNLEFTEEEIKEHFQFSKEVDYVPAVQFTRDGISVPGRPREMLPMDPGVPFGGGERFGQVMDINHTFDVQHSSTIAPPPFNGSGVMWTNPVNIITT